MCYYVVSIFERMEETEDLKDASLDAVRESLSAEDWNICCSSVFAVEANMCDEEVNRLEERWHVIGAQPICEDFEVDVCDKNRAQDKNWVDIRVLCVWNVFKWWKDGNFFRDKKFFRNVPIVLFCFNSKD